jgi:HEAT repeat protein
VNPVLVEALGELIATAIATSLGKSWTAIKRSPEAKRVRDAIDQALLDAFRDAYCSPVTADDDWVIAVAGIWEQAFTTDVLQALVRCLANVNDGEREFAAVAVQALRDSGCDVMALDRVFWVAQFLCVLPRLLFDQLQTAALESNSAARDLVGHLLDQRAEARATRAQIVSATPRQFRDDTVALLHRLDEEARTGRLPPYLPRGADVSRLACTVRVRPGVRIGLHPEASAEAASEQAYQLPVERAAKSESAAPWPEVATGKPRVVVLGDPGLGKSWLIRTETHRLCRQALTTIERGDDVGALLIPLPVRCDQLVACDGESLAEAATGYLVAQRLVPQRSQLGLQARIDAGGIVLLLDALDELASDEDYGRLKELLRSWQTQVGDRARCVLTSRIAGYRGSPLPGADEVELQAFTPEDVNAAIAAWRLPPPVSAQVLSLAADRAVAGMARVPLLLALLCSLAEMPTGEQVPITRGDLYQRVLRWFLTREHRAEDGRARPELRAEEVDALLDILAPVAFHFATLPAGWMDLMPPGQLRDTIRLAGPAFIDRKQPASDIVQELSIDAGILVPAGNPSAGRHPSYLFFHRTFAEYLVARHLASLPEADWLDAVDQHLWFDPDWAEVIHLLGAQLDQGAARRLVEHLLGQADDPFHHGLLTAVRVMGERPDPDQLLPAEHLRAIADRVLPLIDHPVTRPTTASQLAQVPRLPKPVVDGLLARLSERDLDLLLAVVVTLAGLDAPFVTDALLACLDDPDREVRWTVGMALAEWDAPVVTNGLLSRLEAPNPDVRDMAVRGLAGRDAPEVVDGLIGRLADPEPSVREAAVRALAGRNTPAVTDALLDRLSDPEEQVRWEAVYSLAGRDSPEVTDALLTRLETPNPEGQEAPVEALPAGMTIIINSDLPVRRAAVEALADRDAPAVTERLLALLDHRDLYVRRAAVDALAGNDAPVVTDALLARLGDPISLVRLAAATALAGRDTRAVTDALLTCLGDREPFVQQAAIRALSRRHTPAVTAALLDRIEAPDPDVPEPEVEAQSWDELPTQPPRVITADSFMRRAAVEALAGRNAAAVTEALMACLDHRDSHVREGAVQALAGRDTPAVTDALLARLGDEDERVRKGAVQALAGRDTPAVTDALLARLEDWDWNVKRAALEALADRDTPGVAEALLAGLDATSPGWRWVREALVQALAGRDTLAVTDALATRMNDRDPHVAMTAVKALAGQDAVGLLALARHVRSLNPVALQAAYEGAERMASGLYMQLPAESQAGIRADLAWLTMAVCHSRPPN